MTRATSLLFDPICGKGTGGFHGIAIPVLAGVVLLNLSGAAACPAEAQTAEAAGSIEGVVIRKVDATPLEGAKVVLRESGAATVTNADGSFDFTGLTAGAYTLESRLSSYTPRTLSGVAVAPGEVTRVRIELETMSTFLDEIVVTPSRYTLYRDRPDARTSLSREDVEQMPRLGNDVLRAIRRLPGAAGEEVSAEMNVRGGEVNEVQLLVDGLEIYDGMHLKDTFGLFAIVSSEAVDGLDVMTGGFPVEYGNRMSGVIDIASFTSLDRRSTTIDVATTTFGFQSDGQLADGRGQWLLSARRTFLDQMLEWIDPELGFLPVYNDLLGKVRYQLGKRTVLSANVLGVQDDLHFVETADELTGREGAIEEEMETSADKLYGWLGAATAWTPRLYSHTILSYGHDERGREGFIDYPPRREATVDDRRSFDVLGLKQDWSLHLGERQLLKWGLDVRRLDAEYGYTSHNFVDDPMFTGGPPRVADRDIHLAPSGNEYGLYAADRIRLGRAIVAEIGVRWDRQTYVADDQTSPRVSLAYVPGDRARLRAAWGWYYQPQRIHELQVSDGVTTFSQAQRAEHVLIGFDYTVPRGFSLSLEAYHKDLSDLRPRYENQINPIEVFPEVEEDRILVAPQRGEATGVELVLRGGRGGPLDWRLSYAWARAEDRIDGEWVPRSWDQPHTLDLSVNWRPGKRWNLNLIGVHHTGWPTTAVLAEVRYAAPGWRYIYSYLGPRNRERFADYLRFDLRAGYDFRLRSGAARLYLEVINLFNKDNLCRIDSFGFTDDPDGRVTIEEKRECFMPVIPTLGLRFKF